MEKSKNKSIFGEIKESEGDQGTPSSDSTYDPGQVSPSELIVNTNQISAPTVFFVGPRMVGKSVAMIRLLDWFKGSGKISFKPNEGFITRKDDPKYAKYIIDLFNDYVDDTTYAPPPTGLLNYLLIDVIVKTKLFCQMVEVPGEHYFDPNNPRETGFEGYLSNLMFNSKQKKVFVFFFEKNMLNNQQLQTAYAERISQIIRRIDGRKSKIIFLYNKVDLHSYLFINNQINSKTILKEIYGNTSYASIKEAIKSNRKLHHPYFVPFSSGTFGDPEPEHGNRQRWYITEDGYPNDLWDKIEVSIVGSFMDVFRGWF